MWSRDGGWSRKPGPFMLYGAIFGAIGGIGGLSNSSGVFGYTWVSAIAVAFGGALIGFLIWLACYACKVVLAGYRRFRAGN